VDPVTRERICILRIIVVYSIIGTHNFISIFRIICKFQIVSI